ncbi:TPA: DUF4318 domain-containing protein [Clostridium perfringens]
MGNIFKNMMKISIDIPYEDYSVYPTTSITKDAIAKYCIQEKVDYEFLENNEDDNIQIKLDGKRYEILRFYGGRSGYGIKCRPV